MKFKEYLKDLEDLAKKHPESLEFEVIYSHDDEGNEYQKVNFTSSLITIKNIQDNRFLERVDISEERFDNFNAVIIN